MMTSASTRTEPLVAAPGLAVSEDEYEHISLETGLPWELLQGRLREKPEMTWNHRDTVFELGHLLRLQLHRSAFRVHVFESRLRRTSGTICIPDLVVVPTEYGREFAGRSDRLAVHSPPLPLVVEVWSPSTGDYDVETKFPEYRQRGDGEIWRLHPFDRTLTVWRRQDDGSYTEAVHTGGVVEISSLPGVAIDLDELWDT
jgi:Uma2 family endonuclease